MEETVRVCEQKFEDRVRELTTLQAEHEVLKTLMQEKERDLAVFEERASEMEDQMRQFTSIAGMSENDDTFEAVLRAEFALMRNRLNTKIENLTFEVTNLRSDLIRQKGDSQAYIERLKVQMLAMSNRLMKKS